MPSSAPQRILGVIPARYASTRFPGKPIHPIAGKPLVQRVVEQCRRAASLAEVLVATDDARIARVAGAFARVEMTRDDHPSGTDRLAEVAATLECDIVVNVQGDEPLLPPAMIGEAVAPFADPAVRMTTLRRPFAAAGEAPAKLADAA